LVLPKPSPTVNITTKCEVHTTKFSNKIRSQYRVSH
jgi:hypothetical protein